MTDTSLRVATWNLWWRHGDWRARQPAIAQHLAAVDADVVALQEASTGDELDHVHWLRDEMGWHVAVSPPPGERTHGLVNVIASRWPIVETEWRYLDVGDAPPHRTVLWARTEAPLGMVDVFTTHLSHGFDQSALRQRQVCEVAEFVAARRQPPDAGYPPVLMGDFNAVPDADEMRLLDGRSAVPVPGLVFSDVWPQGGEGPGWTYCADSPHVQDSAWPDRRLDYVFVGWPRARPAGNPVSARTFGAEPVDGIVASDHLGVVADLSA